MDSKQNIPYAKFQDTEVLYKSELWMARVVRKSLEIMSCPEMINKEDGEKLSVVWLPAYELL